MNTPQPATERLHVTKCIARALRHPKIATVGAREFRSGFGLTFDDNPTSPRSAAYDSGRELAHIATLRRYDSEC